MNKRKLYAMALASAVHAPAALALQVGPLVSDSTLGRAFEGTMAIRTAPGEFVARERITLLADSVSWNDPHQLAYIEGLRVELLDAGPDQRVLRLTNPAALAVPALSFRVRIDTGPVAMVRSVSVMPAAASTPKPTNRARPPRPRAAQSAKAGDRIRVLPGDSLSLIAQRLARGTDRSWRSLMAELHAANPSAFIRGDINRLRAGADLLLPSATKAPAGAVPTPTATVAVAKAAPAIPAPAPAQDRSDEAPVALRPAVAASVRRTEPTAPPATSERSDNPLLSPSYDPEIAALVAESEARYALLRARYGATSTVATTDARPAAAANPAPRALTPTQPVLASVAQTAPAQPAMINRLSPVAAAAATTAPPMPRKALADAVAEATRAADTAPSPAVEAASVPTRTGFPWRLVFPFIAAAAAVAGLWGWRSRSEVLDEQIETLSHDRREAALRAEVAAKAMQNALTPESLNVEEIRASRVEEFDSTGDLVKVALAQIEEDMSNGLYERAEKDLRAVVTRAPKNPQALLRLAEVLYLTEQAQPFSLHFQSILDTARDELSSSQLNELRRMGKNLCPDDTMFSGATLLQLEPRLAAS